MKKDELMYIKHPEFCWTIEIFEFWHFDKSMNDGYNHDSFKDKHLIVMMNADSKSLALSMMGLLTKFIEKYYVKSDNEYVIKVYSAHCKRCSYRKVIKGKATVNSHNNFVDELRSYNDES